MMSSQVVAWSTSGVWLLAILWLWRLARREYYRLEKHSLFMKMRYVNLPKDEPFNGYEDYIKRVGWEQSTPLSRVEVLARIRAESQTDKQKLATYIEMMPQMGLLGTVLSLFLAAFVFDFTIKMLGLALATTAFGLVGSITARSWLEMPAEELYHGVMERLNNADVTNALVNWEQLHPPKGNPTPSSTTSESIAEQKPAEAAVSVEPAEAAPTAVSNTEETKAEVVSEAPTVVDSSAEEQASSVLVSSESSAPAPSVEKVVLPDEVSAPDASEVKVESVPATLSSPAASAQVSSVLEPPTPLPPESELATSSEERPVPSQGVMPADQEVETPSEPSISLAASSTSSTPVPSLPSFMTKPTPVPHSRLEAEATRRRSSFSYETRPTPPPRTSAGLNWLAPTESKAGSEDSDSDKKPS